MKRISTHLLVLASIMMLLSACGDDSEATSLITTATSSHTGAKPAVHMELKQDGEIICNVYGTPEDARPTVEDCPNGEYLEQLFDKDWNQFYERDVVVGSTTNPNPGEAPVRNLNPEFFKYDNGVSFENTPPDQLDFSKLTEKISKPFDGGREGDGNGGRLGDGNFRVSCQWSHFSKDDPILEFGKTDAAHLHMFFGKTNTNAFTDKDNVAESGGGTCNGFALNRSAYWTPALLNSSGKAVIPKTIFVYYKSTRVPEFGVDRMPQGLQLLGGNIKSNPNAPKPSKDSYDVFWSCGKNGSVTNKTGTLSGLNCEPDDPINATIYFPQCVQETFRGSGKPKLSSDDGFSHTFRLNSVIDACPADYPIRIPELGILLYYPSLNEMNQTSLAGWKLSSDMGAAPGSTLHADWIGGWQDDTMDLWVNKCNRNQRNCSIGQTGTADLLKNSLSGTSSFDWTGSYFVTPPK